MTCRDLVFIDTETTGLDPERHEIIEVAAVRVRPDTLTEFETFCARIRPTRIETAEPEALHINGYSEAWGGRSVHEVLAALAPVLDGAMVAGHNVGFDVGFISATWRHVFLKPNTRLGYHTLDTVTLAWPLLRSGRVTSLSLAAICEHLGISNDGAHSALADARRSLEVARRLLPLAKETI